MNLFSVLYGSRLYGTFTEKSDYDYKVIFLPPLTTLVLNEKVPIRKEKPEGISPSDSMPEGETETEYIPFQTFLVDFFSGQTYALEVAFAVLSGQFIGSELAKGIVQELVSKFLTSDMQKMVGYAVAQSRVYGVKTLRLKSLLKMLETSETYFKESKFLPEDIRIIDCPQLIESLCSIEFVQKVILANSQEALNICGKKFPLTNQWSTLLRSVKETANSYGTRAKEFVGEGADWKALSHAVRITQQVVELLTAGSFIFPRPNAEELRAIRRGERPLSEVLEQLEQLHETLETLTPILKAKTPALEADFLQWKEDILFSLYGLARPN